MAKTISPKAGSLDLVFEEGAGFTLVITKRDENKLALNLSGYTARLSAKKGLSSSTVEVDLTTENGSITLGTAENNITITVTAATIAAYTWDRVIYNLYLTPLGEEPEKELTGTISRVQGT